MGRAKKTDLAEHLRKDLSDAGLLEFLRRAGLPTDYPDLNDKAKRKARLAVLSSWYNKDKTDQLCNNVNKFLQAMFLWAEYYIKPHEYYRGDYYYDDPLCKYEMLRSFMSPPLVVGEPSKSIHLATRRLGKTQTLVFEMCSMVAANRPFSRVLISEFNDTRNKEEIAKIKELFEINDYIQRDLGGPGELYPKGKESGAWNQNVLTFKRFPKCMIMGHSLNSAQRGRGPILGIWDDPESDDESYNKEWRRRLFHTLFNVYLPMFPAGSVFGWIATPIHNSSCVSLAYRGVSNYSSEDEEAQDDRFKYFRRSYFPGIIEKSDGTLIAQQPQRLSVKGYRNKIKALGYEAAQAEIMCRPVNPGMRAFPYAPERHGYMVCGEKGPEYIYILKTGEKIDWEEFTSSLAVFGAGDLADGQTAQSDPGAAVYIGVDPQGRTFVLDCFVKRCFAEHLIEMAYILAELNNCDIFGWEKSALQTVINRMAERHVNELRAKGKTPPVFRELNNAGKNKTRRVLTMTPLFGKDEIFFRQFEAVTIDATETELSVVHNPAPYERERMYNTLINQVRCFTDEGLNDHDDAIDALEMACRLAGGIRGQRLAVSNKSPDEETLDKWDEIGLSLRESLPCERWTTQMEKERLSLPEEQSCYDVVPYL